MGQTTVCRLGPSDLAALLRLLDTDVIQNTYLRSELRLGLSHGSWWGVAHRGGLSAAMLGGPLVVPFVPTPEDAAPMADALRHQALPRMIVGPRNSALSLHNASRPFRRPLELRDPQPLLALRRGQGPPAPRSPVRRAVRADLESLTVAAAAMHREEMGVDPLIVDAAGWRSRMISLIDRRWSFVWMERGEVLFKAELSAWTPEVVQLQGVFTAPGHRGRGIGSAGLAAVCAEVLAEVPVCTLYVNAYNQPALRLYARLGFEAAGDYATVIY